MNEKTKIKEDLLFIINRKNEKKELSGGMHAKYQLLQLLNKKYSYINLIKDVMTNLTIEELYEISQEVQLDDE